MCQICLIIKDNQVNQLLSIELQNELGCEIRRISDFDLMFNDAEVYQPDVLIIDMPSLCQPEVEFFDSLRRLKPEVFIIAMVADEKRLSAEKLTHHGVDDIFVRPPDMQQVYQIKERLLSRIAVFERLTALQEKLRKEMRQSQIVAKSKAMREIMCRLPQLATSTFTVLISGETGTGKELIARAIHYLGHRAGQPFVTVDCGAMPENLVENELFGHVRGAYTDAGPPTKGLIQEADGGTLFLDEIESLSLAVQSKFLRFLQEKQFKPLGHSKYISVDVRVLAATNIDLAQAVKQNAFRQDLYYRLNVIPVSIPSLRQRKADIPALIHYFLQRYAQNTQNLPEIPHEILQSWLTYPWPGNVRELENKVQEWLMMRETDTWNAEAISADTETAPFRPLTEVRAETLAKCERTYLEQLMSYTKGNITEAARLAQMNRKWLGILLKKRGIDVNRFRF